MGKSRDKNPDEKRGEQPEYLTPREAAALSGLTEDALRARAVAGRLGVIRTPGGHRRYRRSDVEAAKVPRNGRRRAERRRRGRQSG
jgi:excisionase family DNA binding protein